MKSSVRACAVQKVRDDLGIGARHRRIEEVGGDHVLRESPAPFAARKGSICAIARPGTW